MMYGPEKSDPVVVAGKPTNKAERFAAELAEPRTGTKGNADQLSTCWTQGQARVSQALERIRQCSPSAPVRQTEGLHGGRISGSS
jgi:RNA-directed DNA polymerase